MTNEVSDPYRMRIIIKLFYKFYSFIF